MLHHFDNEKIGKSQKTVNVLLKDERKLRISGQKRRYSGKLKNWLDLFDIIKLILLWRYILYQIKLKLPMSFVHYVEYAVKNKIIPLKTTLTHSIK